MAKNGAFWDLKIVKNGQNHLYQGDFEKKWKKLKKNEKWSKVDYISTKKNKKNKKMKKKVKKCEIFGVF